MLASRDIAIAICTTFVWALNVLLTKIALVEISPISFNLLRMIVVLPLVVIFPLRLHQWRCIMPTALVWGVAHYAFLGLGIKAGAGVAMGGLLLQLNPLFAALFAYLMLRESPNKYHLIAFVPLCAGVFWGLYTAEKFCVCVGYLCMLVSAAFMGLGNVLLKRAMHDSREPLSPSSAIVAFAPLTIGIHFTLAMSVDGWQEVVRNMKLLARPTHTLIMLFAGWISMVGAMRAWSILVRRYSVADVSPYSLLIPCFTLAFAFLTGEKIGFNTFVSALLILLGLIISQMGHAFSRFVRGFFYIKRQHVLK